MTLGEEVKPQGPAARVQHAIRLVLSGKGTLAATAQTFLTKLSVLFINAATSVIVARVLRPEGRGEMAALAMWSGFLGGLLTLGLPSSLVYNIRRDPGLRKQYLGASLLLCCGLSAAIGTLGFFGLPYWLSKYSPHFISLARWFLLSAPIPIFLVVGRAALEADGHFSQSNMSWSLAPLITLIGLCFLAATHRLAPVTGSLCYVLGSVPVLLWLLVEVFRRYRPTFKSSKQHYRRLIQYGVRCWGIDLLTALSLQADQVFVVRFLSPEALGVYVVAASLARLLGSVQNAVVTVLFPTVAARPAADVIALTGRAARITTGCALSGALIVGTLGPTLMRIVYGPEYAATGSVAFRILLAEVVVSGCTQVLAQAYMALGRPGIMTVVQVTGVVVGLSSMTIFIPRYGVSGAALALLLSSSLRFALTIFCFRPVLNSRAPGVLPQLEDLRFVLSRLWALNSARAEIA